MVAAAIFEIRAGAETLIFGRPLLERLLLTCQRIGVPRFFIVEPDQSVAAAALGSFDGSPAATIIYSVAATRALMPADSSCMLLRGNIVTSASQLWDLFERWSAFPESIVASQSANGSHAGIIAVGRLDQLLDSARIQPAPPAGELPFAIDGGAGDVAEAELRLARNLRFESAAKDAPMARWLDRRLSWRISYALARTSITPNQVTLASTALGLLSAWMFAIPRYWPRVIAAILFLASTTIDGIDGELARLKLAETRLGAQLDTLTDNLVHVALFAGVTIGCYRASGSAAFIWLFALLLGGFAMCLLAGRRALNLPSAAP